ncbi:ISAs1 family transposase [Candidatus Tisiphia endosymbiont of Ditula angustiorana]|uniref:ISAs1 family transposase n=1 Tax=Candidatus Tisiphia endosymbiont of Ditula angustiorana TaxID=3066272 RepID=UPI00312C9C59
MSISLSLEKVKDFRKARGKRYSAASVIKLIVVGLLSNRNNLKSISRFAKSFSPKELVMLGFNRNKALCYSNLTLIIRKISPESLREVILELIQYICQVKNIGYDVIHIDGKTLCGSNSHGKEEQRQILTGFSSQLKAITGFIEIENKNEYGSMLEFLSEYDIKGKIVTADASFCHEDICEEVVKQEGEFAFTLKSNEPNLHYYSSKVFDEIAEKGQEVRSFEENTDLQHGRIERRKIEVIDMPFEYLNGFRHIKQICKISRERDKKNKTNSYEQENVFMITSLGSEFNPKSLLKFNKNHWSCENNLNWVKDTVFGEDKSTISIGKAPLVMSLLRTITISVITLFSNKITETRENFNNYRHKLFKVMTT